MPVCAYIHIPFCKNKCNYCSFVSYTNYDDCVRKDYVDNLINEIQYFYQNEELKTLYLGGGTPSLLAVTDIERIVNSFNITSQTEITMEINPETVDGFYLKKIRDIGVNRLSVGIQTFDDEVLKLIGRIHSAQTALNVVKTAQDVGFHNISVDFIYGLPNQNRSGFVADLSNAIELDVQHISLYGLKIEEGCTFYHNFPQNIADDDMQADMYLDAIKTLGMANYKQYEISNFSKPNFESKHNLNYWNNQEYYGFGVAAHGYVNGERYSNHSTFDKYFADYQNKSFKQTLTKEEKLEEAIFLGFRKAVGINKNDINKTFLIDFDTKYKNILEKYLQTGHLQKTSDGYSFTSEGFLISNIILADFID